MRKVHVVKQCGKYEIFQNNIQFNRTNDSTVSFQETYLFASL